ncbi:hypothetical protein AK812_SmicGene42913 [Symbiodinium microadriaticum]|uniref:Uncharacterized protein n=1 Tax=Symbiodinium microadriaticum TaxID=2951 RepID=A0A1Q9C2D9_SYMMI|nr:hypothetical protein AK812_SmicGene42913 [Symbiodinium microadriaticum]
MDTTVFGANAQDPQRGKSFSVMQKLMLCLKRSSLEAVGSSQTDEILSFYGKATQDMLEFDADDSSQRPIPPKKAAPGERQITVRVEYCGRPQNPDRRTVCKSQEELLAHLLAEHWVKIVIGLGLAVALRLPQLFLSEEGVVFHMLFTLVTVLRCMSPVMLWFRDEMGLPKKGKSTATNTSTGGVPAAAPHKHSVCSNKACFENMTAVLRVVTKMRRVEHSINGMSFRGLCLCGLFDERGLMSPSLDPKLRSSIILLWSRDSHARNLGRLLGKAVEISWELSGDSAPSPAFKPGWALVVLGIAWRN